MQHRESQPTPLSFGDRTTVAILRRAVMPLFGVIYGISPPVGRVTERRYGELPEENMDVVEPPPGLPKRLSVVFLHGGGWIAGSKGAFYHLPLLGLADAGHRVFSLNYPLAPEHPHPHALQSLVRALALLYREENLREIHLVGDSAGGNLAVMLGLALSNAELLRTIMNDAPEGLPTVRSAVSLYGVLDRISWIEDGFPIARLFLRAYAGEPAIDPAQSPSIPITPMDVSNVEVIPPMFLGVGTKDQLKRSSRIYAEHLRSRGARVVHKEYEGADHAFYSYKGPASDELRRDVIEFLASMEA